MFNEEKLFFYIPQSFSSDRSSQSNLKSHFARIEIHSPLPQRNFFVASLHIYVESERGRIKSD